MTPERWQRAKAIFQRALDLPATERERYVAEASGDDPEIRSEVASLLAEHAREDGFSLGTEHLPYAATRNAEVTLPMPLFDDAAGLVGTTLDDTYRIVRLLGRGGMGVVYLAEHELLHDRVAVKLLPAADAARADAFRRFLREGRMARAIRHPNVVEVHELRTSSDGLAYMVMEYVEGPTLRDELRRRGAIPLDEALDLLEPVAAALDHAHGLGIVHRDLKPENVIIGTGSGEPVVKLLDLGIARLFDVSDDGPAVTRAGQIVGTPAYMPPEQWGQLSEDGGSEVDARADVYALGVMLFELVSGRAPFSGATSYDLHVAHVREAPPALADLVPSVSRGASAAVARSLSKDRSARQTSAGELIAEARTGVVRRRGARRPGLARRATLNVLMGLGALVVVATVLGMVVAVLIGLGAAGKLGGPSAEPEPRPAAAVEPQEPTLRLSVVARRTRAGEHTVEPFSPSDEDATFADGDGLRVEASSSRDGYLYVVNEGPTLDADTAMPRYTVVFPKPGAGGEAAHMLANDVVRIPDRTWIKFFGSGGRETLWIIWSARPVDALRGVERFVTPEQLGRVTDDEQVGAIRRFLSKCAESPPRVATDAGTGRVSVDASGDTVAYPLYFDHR